MNAERPRQGCDEGAGTRRAADTSIVGEQVDLFAVTRSTTYGNLGTIEYGEVTHDVSPAAGVPDGTPEIATAHRRVAQTEGTESWLKLADVFIRKQVVLRRPFTADEIVAAVGPAPNVNAAAVAVRRAKLRGDICVVGSANSERPESRGHLVRVWQAR